jgi:hypothetical protein
MRRALLLSILSLAGWAVAPAPSPAPTAQPTSQPNPAATSEPTTAPAATKPSLSPEQLYFLHAAESFTEGRKLKINQEVATARIEYNSARSGQILTGLKDDLKQPTDLKRIVTPANKIVYQFRTVAKRKEVTDDLKLKLDRLETEQAALKAGKLRLPPLKLMDALQLKDAGTVDEDALVLEVVSPSEYVVDFHAAVFYIRNATPNPNLEAGKRIPLPLRLAVTGQRDYLKRSGNTETIFVLTAVDDFKLEDHLGE